MTIPYHTERLESEFHQDLIHLFKAYMEPIRGDISKPPSKEYADALELARSGVISLLAKVFLLEQQEGELVRQDLLDLYEDCLVLNIESSWKHAQAARDKRVGKGG